jgi:spermidine synthase
MGIFGKTHPPALKIGPPPSLTKRGGKGGEFMEVLPVLSLGFTSLFFQVFLLREFLSVYYGNELVTGIVLAAWMLLTGAGARLGHFFPKILDKSRFLLFLQIVMMVLPLLTIINLDIFRASSVPVGSMAGMNDILLAAVLLPAPFCLINGFLFTAYNAVYSAHDKANPAGRIYALEAAGSLLAGLLVNAFLIWFFDIFICLRILLVINGAVILVIIFSSGTTTAKIISSFIISSFIISSFLFDIGAFTSRLLFPDQKILSNVESPYGRLTVTSSGSQQNYYGSGLLLFSTGNEIASEEAVHYALLQRPGPKRILLVSGGISGTLKEVLKYRPERIDYVELNPAILEAGKRDHLIPDDPAIHLHKGDARQFIRNSTVKYDAVLVNLPEPSTLQLNRFYTREFLSELKKVLAPGAVVSYSLPAASDYVSKRAGDLHSSLFNTLKENFPAIVIIPGQRDYYLASDSMLRQDIVALSSERNIPAIYVNPYYIDDEGIRERSRYILKNLDPAAPVNSDFRPVTFFRQLSWWTTFSKLSVLLPVLLLIGVLLLLLLSADRRNAGIFAGGFTASSMEVLLLLSFQVICGTMFLALGLIIALFMAGLALGAILVPRLYPEAKPAHYIHLQLTLALFALGFPFVVQAVGLLSLPAAFTWILIGLLTLAVSILTGLEFSVVSALRSADPVRAASRNYATDLVGSSAGALLTALLLLPFLGLTGTGLVLAGMNLVTAGVSWMGWKN